MSFLGVAKGIGSILGGLGGLFGSKKPKQQTPYDGIMSQAAGARDASEKYGFNPLTLLQAGAGHGFSQAGGGTPPLASVAAITEGLSGLDDVLSGDQARRRQADQLELDLAKIRLEEARRGVGMSQPGYASARDGGSFTGNRAATVVQPTARMVPAKFSAGENIVAPGRQEDIAPLTNSPGVFEIENAMTGGQPITIPGDGEPWGIDELATAVIVGVPQVAGRFANQVLYGGKSFADRMSDYRKREAEEPKSKKPKKLHDGPFGPVYDLKY